MNDQEIASVDGSYARELKRLRGEHHKILRLHAAGVSNKKIAELCSCSAVKVSYTINCELGKQKLRHLYHKQDEGFVDQTLEELQSLNPIAVAELEDALVNNSVDKKERIKVAQDILDRTGYGKSKNVNLRKEEVTDEDLKEVKKRAKEKATDAGVMEDAKVVEETEDG